MGIQNLISLKIEYHGSGLILISLQILTFTSSGSKVTPHIVVIRVMDNDIINYFLVIIPKSNAFDKKFDKFLRAGL